MAINIRPGRLTFQGIPLAAWYFSDTGCRAAGTLSRSTIPTVLAARHPSTEPSNDARSPHCDHPASEPADLWGSRPAGSSDSPRGEGRGSDHENGFLMLFHICSNTFLFVCFFFFAFALAAVLISSRASPRGTGPGPLPWPSPWLWAIVEEYASGTGGDRAAGRWRWRRCGRRRRREGPRRARGAPR